MPAQMHTLKDILGVGENATLLYCPEHGGGLRLLSSDARLRAVTGILEIIGASPQMLLTSELVSERLAGTECSTGDTGSEGFLRLCSPFLGGHSALAVCFHSTRSPKSCTGIGSERSYRERQESGLAFQQEIYTQPYNSVALRSRLS